MAKKALCVGINKYGDGNDLSGCVNDARSWSAVLVEHAGFGRGDVTMLLDADATKANMMEGLRALLAGASVGDVLVFTNSSHGTYVADTSHDEAYDQALCPVDCAGGIRYLIIDDELRTLFQAIPAGVSMTVISDSCHSGTVTRAADAEPGAADDRRPRFLNPRAIGLPVLEDPPAATPRGPTKYPQAGMKELLLSGCTKREYSWDATIHGTPHGAMTYFALKVMREAQYGITWADLHTRLRSQLEAAGYDQHPQLEGTPANKKKPIFT
jgi:hypothetical protein